MANGLNEKRMEEHIKRLRAADAKGLGIRVLVGSEVDILKDGSLDYSDEILAQLDVVVCSIHSYFNLERAEMTERMLAAIENPYTQIIAHPTGRLLLRRDPIDYDMEKILDACAKHGVAMECNSYPDRLDLKDVYLRMCKDRGVKVVISTDSAQCRESVLHPVWGDDGPAGLAGEERRHQYPAHRKVSGGAESKTGCGIGAFHGAKRKAAKGR